ncbi:sugar ABC transporter permease [Angustibacter aerolatus]|uniref:Sugar ABC transporter permease n=1 Tax=Angustibacter aerolatus TaxID=1162965 RepID=A0ABQ6JKL9_9ACTN|nr:carbohydrate ABC transporter permease [Angustibacter aerolatus]GMA87694.1 sugar ABC transporter permease [Angustibacter aerolatus]
MHLWPQHPTLERYQAILGGDAGSVAGALRAAVLNSFVVATCSVAVSLACGALGAYAVARLRFRFKRGAVLMLLVTYMMPPLALVIPIYLALSALGLLDNKIGLIVVYCSFTTPFVLWLLSAYFQSLPVELEEAARIDGCSRLGALWRVVLPLARPGLISAGLLGFLGAWDEFFYALILTSSPAAKTIPVALTEFTGRYSLDFGLMAAGGVIAALPPVLIALVLQRYITSGLTAGAIK